VAETTTKGNRHAASIAEGTIYRYFPSKERLALDLFLAITRARRGARRSGAATSRAALPKIEAIVRCLLRRGDATGRCSPITSWNQHSFLLQVPTHGPTQLEAVREVIAQA